jgi:imidazolonepropionase
MAEGVTTVEIKSGYGLETEAERRMLRVARRLGADQPVTVRTTFLGAHAVAPEFEGRADDYIARVADEMLPALAADGLVDAVDGFVETIGFTVPQTERVFEAAADLGLPVKLHADQLSDSKGAVLEAGTVAVLLPGAFYFLRETQVPPVGVFRRVGVPMALATDCNPGSAPVTSLLLMLNMGCTLFGLTPTEALSGVTRNAARALGLLDDRGTLEVGKAADLAVWDTAEPADLVYRMGFNGCRVVVKDGRVVKE